MTELTRAPEGADAEQVPPAAEAKATTVRRTHASRVATSKLAPAERSRFDPSRKARVDHEAMEKRRKEREAKAVRRAARDAEIMAGKNPGRGRRPALLPTDEIMSNLASLGALDCTHDEVAAFLGVNTDTVTNFFAAYPKAIEAFENGRGRGRVSLRRIQMRLAEKNAAMAIWLGKQRLGQTDKLFTVNEDGPEKAKATEELRARAVELMERLGLVCVGAGERDGADEFPILAHRK